MGCRGRKCASSSTVGSVTMVLIVNISMCVNPPVGTVVKWAVIIKPRRPPQHSSTRVAMRQDNYNTWESTYIRIDSKCTWMVPPPPHPLLLQKKMRFYVALFILYCARGTHRSASKRVASQLDMTWNFIQFGSTPGPSTNAGQFLLT